jgi:hypothetical protein
MFKEILFSKIGWLKVMLSNRSSLKGEASD